jgi:hypothetical protein
MAIPWPDCIDFSHNQAGKKVRVFSVNPVDSNDRRQPEGVGERRGVNMFSTKLANYKGGRI